MIAFIDLKGERGSGLTILLHKPTKKTMNNLFRKFLTANTFETPPPKKKYIYIFVYKKKSKKIRKSKSSTAYNFCFGRARDLIIFLIDRKFKFINEIVQNIDNLSRITAVVA